jgi:hypothetical protein
MRTRPWLAGLLLALLVGTGWWAIRRLAGDDIVRIAAPEFDPSRRDWLSAVRSERGRETPVSLRVQPGSGLEPWLRVAIHQRPESPAEEILVLGHPDAVVAYHAASRVEGFAYGLLRNRLGLIEAGAGREPRVGLLIRAEELEHARIPLPELGSTAKSARMLALAETLGAWDLLREGRVLRTAEGRPILPPFVPRLPGDFNKLVGSSLEGFLPEPLAAFVASQPLLRQASYRDLFELSGRLPELRAEISELAEELGSLGLTRDFASLQSLVSSHFDALQGYLDSVWAESIVTEVSPDALSIAFYLHTVVPVRIDAFTAGLPRQLALESRPVLGTLKLQPLGAGAAAAARPELDRVVFALDQPVEPIALGPYRFQSSRIDYRLEGLADSEALRLRLLQNLRPRLTNLISGKAVPADHVRRLAAIDDPRFGAAGDEGAEAFAAALPRRLSRIAGGDPGASEGLTPDGVALRLTAGRYRLSEDLILPTGLGLVLEAGVELEVAPTRSILVRGPVRIEGTADLPVRIRGTSESEPWGVFAIQGGGAGPPLAGEPRLRAEIRFLELEGGFEDELRGAYYSGQLSIYHQDLEMSQTTLRRSHADDSLNVKYGRVVIRDSAFLDSFADAIDLDWTQASIERSLFARTGPNGDGVDVSGSTASIDDTVFSEVQDKCVSVGERSQAVIRGSLLRSCTLGVASKDLSETRIEESLFLHNQRDLAAYQKKEVFGAARLRAEDVILAGAESAPETDVGSEIEIVREVELAASEATAGDAEGAVGLDLAGLSRVSSFSAARYRELRRRLP